MMNVSHAKTGAIAALALGPTLGMHTLLAVAPFALTFSGWATGPDLDCEGAKPSNVFGPVGHGVSAGVRGYSAWLYRHSEGPRDDHHNAGTHRHASHTPFHCILAGVLATVTTSVGGTFGAVAAIVWMVFGVGLAAMVLGRTVGIIAIAVSAAWLMGTPLTGHNLLYLAAAHASWIGLAVGGGCLVHVAGDAITHAGVPLLFPKLVKQTQMRWGCYGILPRFMRFAAGGTFERVFVYPVLVVTTVLLIPGVWPIAWPLAVHTATAIHHAL